MRYTTMVPAGWNKIWGDDSIPSIAIIGLIGLDWMATTVANRGENRF